MIWACFLKIFVFLVEGVPALGCQDSALRPKAKAKSRSEQGSGETDEGKTSEDVSW